MLSPLKENMWQEKTQKAIYAMKRSSVKPAALSLIKKGMKNACGLFGLHLNS